ncbi:MAG: RagB/SusD family nutrient uptake outer membrane protein [Cyclobacteriaceae bacterium]
MLVIVLATVTACDESDLLDQTNPNALAPSNFWRNADDAKRGIMGAYAPFTDIWYYTRFEIFLSDYRDDLVNGYNISERTAAGNFNADPASNGAKWVWSAMYKGISRSNEVIANVPAIEMDQTAKNNILGEAYFIRAFNYFNLLNYWRNVPLILIPSGQVENARQVPQADPLEVYNQIVADLTEAANLLPTTWTNSDDLGRVRKVSAIGMLGKAHLYQGNWDLAKTEFQKVMNDGSVGLVDDYRDNFREASENNFESLFEVQMKNNADGKQGWCADCANHGAGAGFHQDLTTRPYGGQDGLRINDWALTLFLDEKTVNDEIDPRAFSTLIWDTPETTTYEGDVLGAFYYEGKTFEEAWGVGDTRIFPTKHLDFEQGYTAANAGGWHRSGNNLRILRYADILLMFAEAEFNLNGSSAAALAAINEVRARVDMPAHTSITMQDIEDERIKELSLERTRYYDLLRWGKVKERVVDASGIKSESGGTGAYRPGREYIAIPLDEMNNSDVFVQNQGWDAE